MIWETWRDVAVLTVGLLAFAGALSPAGYALVQVMRKRWRFSQQLRRSAHVPPARGQRWQTREVELSVRVMNVDVDTVYTRASTPGGSYNAAVALDSWAAYVSRNRLVCVNQESP